MKRKFGFILGLVIIIGLVIGGMKILGSRSPKQGVLKVESNSTASIFLGTNHLGRTPYEEKTDAGEYTLKLVPESTVIVLSTWQGNIKIQPGLLTYVNADLAESDFTTAVSVLWLEKITSKMSEVSVATNPDGATVAIDGEMKGVTPVAIPNIASGDHTLSVSSPGFLTRTVKFKTTAGYRLNTVVKLALSGQPTAEATPTATPTATSTPKSTKTSTATSSATPNPPKPYALIKDTPTGFLRVRLEPSTSATEAAKVNPGDKFTILDTQEGWYKISYDGTNTGWISGQYAEKVE